MSHASINSQLLQPRSYPQKLSLVIPMYNEEAVVPFLRSAVAQFMSELASGNRSDSGQ